MSVAHHVPAVRAPSLTSALGTLRAHGLRVSSARRLALKVLYAADRPISAEALVAELPGADLASMYRNLVVLEALGLVRHVHLGHGPGLYSVTGTQAVQFVTCDRCGDFEAVEPVRLDAVRRLIEEELGYLADFTHFPIVGICPSCRGAS